MIVPSIRQDLKLSEGPKKEDGSASWLLYDSLRNKYFSINKKAFDLLKNWSSGIETTEFIEKIKKSNLSITKEEIEEFISFLNLNNLTIKKTGDEVKSLVVQKEKLNKHWLLKIIHNYLFFKIPLFKPGNGLENSLPFALFLGSQTSRLIIYILGIIGIFLTIQNYETFLTTFSYFFNVNGLILFGITIVFVKALHELGHAYVATYYKCKVSSIGLAMLVFFPFLYTDTTDAYKLTDHRKRLLINFAGMLTELHLALLATFVWAVSPEGVIKSASFFIATSSWISSLLINISPFMRFDGYYVLSDFLKAENLQPRSFALGRWQIREWIFGFKFQPPEQLMSQRRWTFIIYAWMTWIYRFFIFIGIALLVYYLTFKILGIILFIIEIVWFILLPIWREIRQWWGLRRYMRFNWTFLRSIFIFSVFLAAMLVPWRSSLSLPAVIDRGEVVDIYPTEDSEIKEIFIISDQQVEKGDLLITMMSPSLSNKVDKAIERVKMIQQKLDRRIGSEADMSNLMVLENQLKVEFEILKSLKEENENLSIYAPMSGVIKDLKYLNNGQWVNIKEKLFSIVQFNDTKVVAFISENDLDKLEGNTSGYFVPKNNEFDEAEVVLVSQNNTSTEELPYLSLVSTFGGSIASREVKGDGKVVYRPEEALYQLNFSTSTEVETVQWQTAGKVKIQTENYNIFQNLFNLISSTLIRESGF